MQPGLRERKKQAARQAISNVATGLIFEHGFDNVTVAEIAEAAGFSKMTVFNYFPRKEDMFLDRRDEAEELLLGAIRARPPGLPVVEAVRALMHRLLAEGHPLSGAQAHVAVFGRVVADSPALRSRAREQRDELESAVAALLTEETGDPLGADLVGKLLLATLHTVLTTAAQRLMAGDTATAVAADQIGVIDRAFDLLANGIGDIGADAPRSPHTPT
ncbi:TetR/AcrR family transcriptional regulator [Streptomyces sp. NPDC088400]|uniref:TetR/AcrR family transcriptional regulator n=1 Tax=Streptomyces sp. NPDC088400 TaxID=3365861 RepID=UPI00380666A4